MTARAEAAGDPMLPRRYRVRSRHRECADTETLVIDPLDRPLPPFAPGQFAMLYAFGVGEVPISVSATPDDGSLVHTVRAVGPVSRMICAAEPGTVLGVRGPFGTSWSAEDADGGDLVVIAGGVGLAPLRPVVHQALADRGSFGSVCVLVGARSPDLLLYRAETGSWGDALHVAVTVDHAAPSWTGHVGVVTELLAKAPFSPERTLAVVCGPEVMMRFAARALADAGVPEDRIRISMERNMKCAVGHCGHCQFGPDFVCTDGAVFAYSDVRHLPSVREV
jgi:anaerobic sulfite reductase subunit B